MSGAVPPPQPAQLPHILSLRVLRTTQPSLIDSVAAPYRESKTTNGITPTQGQSRQGESEAGMLLLPSTFGAIFLGETFTAVLCLSNNQSDQVHPLPVAVAPSMKCEMHATSGFVQPLSMISLERLAPGESHETVISFECKELGMMALVCTIKYGAEVAEVSRTFRKVFKFNVSNPLSVRTKAHSAQTGSQVFLEVQIQNLTEHALSFEKMLFEPMQDWTAEAIERATVKTVEDDLLPPQAVHQYLYILQPSPALLPALPGSAEPLGRLDIAWRSANGGGGKLMTSLLGRKVPELGGAGAGSISSRELSTSSSRIIIPGLDFDLSVSPLASTPVLGKSFQLEFTLKVRESSASSASSRGRKRRIRLAAQFYKLVEGRANDEQEWDESSALSETSMTLPAPVKYVRRRDGDTSRVVEVEKSQRVIKMGSSLLELEEITLSSEGEADAVQSAISSRSSSTVIAFSAALMPVELGLIEIGGIRILLLHDDESELNGEAKIVVEMDIYTTVYITSS